MPPGQGNVQSPWCGVEGPPEPLPLPPIPHTSSTKFTGSHSQPPAAPCSGLALPLDLTPLLPSLEFTLPPTHPSESRPKQLLRAAFFLQTHHLPHPSPHPSIPLSLSPF